MRTGQIGHLRGLGEGASLHGLRCLSRLQLKGLIGSASDVHRPESPRPVDNFGLCSGIARQSARSQVCGAGKFDRLPDAARYAVEGHVNRRHRPSNANGQRGGCGKKLEVVAPDGTFECNRRTGGKPRRDEPVVVVEIYLGTRRQGDTGDEAFAGEDKMPAGRVHLLYEVVDQEPYEETGANTPYGCHGDYPPV